MRPVFAFPFLVRLRDHGAWPGISQYSISHLAFFFISHLAFFISYRAFFISHFYLASRIFISHLAFLSRMSHFYVEFTSRNFFLLLLLKSHLECSLQAWRKECRKITEKNVASLFLYTLPAGIILFCHATLQLWMFRWLLERVAVKLLWAFWKLKPWNCTRCNRKERIDGI